MIKRMIRILSAAMLLASLAFLLTGAFAETNPRVRVWLHRLQVQDVIQIDVNGEYMLEDGSMTFADGAKMVVQLRQGQLVLHASGVAVRMGERMTLVRCAGDNETSGLRLCGNSGLYQGDLVLSISDGAIRPVLSIGVEDYLLGVVPYEMGDSFPLEALKAQAIAARTYALRKQGANADYDVEDTTNDQAYRGRSDSSPLSEQAVRETAGIVGIYNGALAKCYYSASNGGQTELGEHVWPTDDPNAYGYMDMRDDPYDLENGASSVKRYTVPKKPGKEGIGEALHALLTQALAPQLEQMGCAAESDLVRFDEIRKITLDSPKFEGDSRLMTEMTFEVRVSVRECIFRDMTTPEPQAAQTVAPQTIAEPTPEPTPSPTPAPTATPAYTKYKQISDTLTITVPYFGGAERAMGLSINTAANELVTVTDIGSAYMIEARRFGHGVGMSQRGAEQMARKYGKSCDEILAFYYPGMLYTKLETEAKPSAQPDREMMATPVPTASPTPRPTFMPVTADKLPRGAYLAIVTNIDEDSTLNLRSGTSLSADVILRLYKNQQVIVLKAYSNGWSKVKTDVVEGYVKSEFLQSIGK